MAELVVEIPATADARAVLAALAEQFRAAAACATESSDIALITIEPDDSPVGVLSIQVIVGQSNGRALCSVSGCPRATKAKGYCEMHWRRVKATGSPGPNVPSRRLRRITADGYTVNGPGTTSVHGYRIRNAPGHPNAAVSGAIAEHRLVMGTKLRRPLHEDESVHHKNGVKLDNRIENLELRNAYHGKGQDVTDRIEDAIQVLERYAPELLAKQSVQLRVVA